MSSSSASCIGSINRNGSNGGNALETRGNHQNAALLTGYWLPCLFVCNAVENNTLSKVLLISVLSEK